MVKEQKEELVSILNSRKSDACERYKLSGKVQS
jgi:hypothetical protein